MGWNTFTFIIGSMDDFESADELIEHFDTGLDRFVNQYASYEFDAPSGLDDDMFTAIGRGMAFSDGWSMDGSISFVVKGVV